MISNFVKVHRRKNVIKLDRSHLERIRYLSLESYQTAEQNTGGSITHTFSRNTRRVLLYYKPETKLPPPIRATVITAAALFYAKYLHISKIIRTFAAQFKIPCNMKRISLFILLATLFVACEKGNQLPPKIDGAKADFTHTIDANNPLKVTFKNNSTAGLSAYLWNIDTIAYAYNRETITHTFDKGGTYDIELICKGTDGYTYACSKYVTVSKTEPTAPDTVKSYNIMYVSGVRFYKIPYDNKYYKIVFSAKPRMGNTETLKTSFPNETFSSSDLPLTLNFTDKFNVGEFPNPTDWYKEFSLQVLWADKRSASGTQCMLQTVDPSKTERLTEWVFTSNNGETKVGLLFSYE